MNAILENKVSMYFKVREFFSNHLATLSASAPGLATSVATFNTHLDTMEELLKTAGENNTGYAEQKQVNYTAMRGLCLSVAGAVYAHASIIKDKILAAKAQVNKSTLDGMRDTEVLFQCQRIYDLAKPIAPDLEPLGVPEATITDFQAAIEAYRLVLQDPADRRSATKSANQEATSYLDIIDEDLSIVDALMLVQHETQPLLYNQYRADRLIDDNASGNSDPDVTQIIGANTLRAILNQPYQASRKFRLVNNGTVAVLWGLSSSDTEASHPLSGLAAGASSSQLSSTLAPDGNFLLVKNETSLPTEVDLYIVEE